MVHWQLRVRGNYPARLDRVSETNIAPPIVFDRHGGGRDDLLRSDWRRKQTYLKQREQSKSGMIIFETRV